MILPPRHRAALNKCRYVAVPLRIETGRYGGLVLFSNPELVRICVKTCGLILQRRLFVISK